MSTVRKLYVTAFFGLGLALGAWTPASAADRTGAAPGGSPAGPAATAASGSALSVQAGKQLYQRWCVACHGAGPGHPGTTALDALYSGAVPSVLETGTSLDATAIAYFVRNGRSTMPTFRKSEISDSELASIAAYLTAPKEKVVSRE